MYLAGILGLCALLHVPVSGHVRSEVSSFRLRGGLVPSQAANQEPTKPDQAGAQESQQDQPKPDATRATPQESQPSKNDATPETSNPPAINPRAKVQPSPAKPNTAGTPQKHAATKNHSSPTSTKGSQKKVVRRGSTAEPSTKLAPSITTEQAARQRETTNQLLASTDASLQKLSGRQLTKEQQETVVQIRKFMEQVKTADAAGDLQRAYKLAVKAHLLSDSLAKP